MTDRFHRSVAVLGIAVLTAALAACDIAVDGQGGWDFDLAAGKAQDEWTRSYPLAAGGRLELINVNGRIVAEPASGNTVEIRGERTAKATSDDAAKQVLDRIEMREEVGDSRVRIEVRPPRMTRSGHEIKWTIRVPKGVSVDLRTVNGGVKVTGLDADVRARSTNGGITAGELTGHNIDAAVTNGQVDVALAAPISDGAIELESVNGGITLALPPDSRASVAARCTNGSINVDGLPIEVRGEQNRRRLEGTLNGGGARISIDTVNGGVRLGRTAT